MSKITESARDMPCIRCGREGETRAAHYNGPMQHIYGKGRGIKCDDIATAEFCQKCDDEFSEGSTNDRWSDKWERSHEFLNYIILTNIRRFKTGILTIR